MENLDGPGVDACALTTAGRVVVKGLELSQDTQGQLWRRCDEIKKGSGPRASHMLRRCPRRELRVNSCKPSLPSQSYLEVIARCVQQGNERRHGLPGGLNPPAAPEPRLCRSRGTDGVKAHASLAWAASRGSEKKSPDPPASSLCPIGRLLVFRVKTPQSAWVPSFWLPSRTKGSALDISSDATGYEPSSLRDRGITSETKNILDLFDRTCTLRCAGQRDLSASRVPAGPIRTRLHALYHNCWALVVQQAKQSRAPLRFTHCNTAPYLAWSAGNLFA